MTKTTEGAKENLFVCKYTWILVCCWWCSISIVGCQMWGPNSGFDQSLRRQELHEFAKCICPNCKMYLSKLQNVFVKIAKWICMNCGLSSVGAKVCVWSEFEAETPWICDATLCHTVVATATLFLPAYAAPYQQSSMILILNPKFCYHW